MVDERRARSRDYGGVFFKKWGEGAKGRRALDGSLVEGQEQGWEDFKMREESVAKRRELGDTSEEVAEGK